MRDRLTHEGKAKKCGRDRPTRRRQRRDACGSAARGGGDERLYVRAVTATSGDAGERRDRPGDDSTANTADAVEQKRGRAAPTNPSVITCYACGRIGHKILRLHIGKYQQAMVCELSRPHTTRE